MAACLRAATRGMTMPASIETLINFNGTDGLEPDASLIIDPSNGDLLGVTAAGGSTFGSGPNGLGYGTVFAIAYDQATDSYATTPTVLASFDNSNDGGGPDTSLITDTNGDLFGTATYGGLTGLGTVFEISYHPATSSYATTPTVLANFNGTDGTRPVGSLIFDATGSQLGVTVSGGEDDDGTVFAITYDPASHGPSTPPRVIANFTGTDGASPASGLIADANGDLFGVTARGGTSNDGVVYEIQELVSGYGNPVVLANFDGSNGRNRSAGLIADANGDLFGTTVDGGQYGDGTVFEIPKTAFGYGALITLASFNGYDGANPTGGLIADANGDLFGTTYAGGSTFAGGANGGGYGDGTVFELQRTGSQYGSIVTVVSFTGSNGEAPAGSLNADANGDLFGTTELGGTNPNFGTVFEIPNGGPYNNSGFAILAVVNGPGGGFGTVQGPRGPASINVFGYGNTIFANGGNDTIYAGDGRARVYVSTGNVVVKLAGALNVVQGFPGFGNTAASGADGADTVTGAANFSSIVLGNGPDTIDLTGVGISVNLGNGNNNVTLPGDFATITAGNGNNNVLATGWGDTIQLGSGTNVLQVGNDTSIGLGGGTDTVTAGTGDSIVLNATTLQVEGGANCRVLVASGPSSIDDHSSGLVISIGPGSGSVAVLDIADDPGAVIDLTGGVGGYHTVGQVLAALTSDGAGGTKLALGSAAAVDFVGTSASILTAAHFRLT